jgi:hypothetical protein
MVDERLMNFTFIHRPPHVHRHAVAAAKNRISAVEKPAPTSDDTTSVNDRSNETQDWGSRLVWSIPALLAAVYATLAMSGRLLYQTFDEPRMANLVESVLEPNDIGCTIVLMQAWLGHVIAGLAAAMPTVRWYAMLLLVGSVVALWRMLATLQRHGCGSGGLLAAAAVCVLGYTMLEPGFTSCAALLAGAALLPLVLPGHALTTPATRLGEALLSLLLMALAVGLRDAAAGLQGAVAGGAFVALRGHQLLPRGGPARQSLLMLMVAAALAGGLTFVGRHVPATPEANRFRAYFRRNVEITDYHRTAYAAAWAEPLGISPNDFTMIRSHFVTDSGPFRYDVLAACPNNAPRGGLGAAVWSLARQARPEEWTLLAILVGGCLLRPRLAGALVVALTLLVWIRWTCDRMQPRIAMPTLALPAVVAVAAASRHRWAGIWSLSWPLIVAAAGGLAVLSWSARVARYEEFRRDEAIAWDTCAAAGIRPFHWGPSSRSLEMFHRPAGAEATAIRVGSWANSHPARLRHIHSLVGADMYAAMVRAGTHHVMTGAGDRNVMETFLREHGPAGLRLTRLLDIPRAMILRIDSAPEGGPLGDAAPANSR